MKRSLIVLEPYLILSCRKRKKKPSTLLSFPTFQYSPGDTVLVSLDSQSGSRGRQVIVKKITKVFTTFTNQHKCKHEHVLPLPPRNARTPPNVLPPPPRNARTPPNARTADISSPSLEALKTNLSTMQDEMNEIVYLMRRLQTRMTTTEDLIEDFKAFEDFKRNNN